MSFLDQSLTDPDIAIATVVATYTLPPRPSFIWTTEFDGPPANINLSLVDISTIAGVSVDDGREHSYMGYEECPVSQPNPFAPFSSVHFTGTPELQPGTVAGTDIPAMQVVTIDDKNPRINYTTGWYNADGKATDFNQYTTFSFNPVIYLMSLWCAGR